MSRRFHRSPQRVRGFTLMELLIGVMISMMGLAAVGIMMQNFSKKRTAITQTLSAQDNGVMALYRLERDISQAGYGLMNLQNCGTIQNGAQPSFAPYPVQITWGGAGATDSITVRYANSVSGIPGTELDASGGNSMTDTRYNVRSNVGFSTGDTVVSTLACAATTVGTITVSTNIPYTYGGAALTASSSAGYLANLGQPGEFIHRQYGIGPSALTVADYPAFSTNNLVDNIVYLKAQYGISSAVTGSPATVVRWVDGATTLTGTGCGAAPPAAAPASIHPSCVVAIRIGVVARSASAGPENIDQPNPLPVLPRVPADTALTEIGAAETYAIASANSNVRYRAYSTIIPLKNVLWGR